LLSISCRGGFPRQKGTVILLSPDIKVGRWRKYILKVVLPDFFIKGRFFDLNFATFGRAGGAFHVFLGFQTMRAYHISLLQGGQ